MKVFVTGATGFIGSAIVRELVSKGFSVTGLVHRKAGAHVVEEAGGSVVVGDLLAPDSWKDALRETDLVVSASQPFKSGEKLSFAEARRRSYYHGQMVGNIFLAAQGTRVQGVLLTYGVLGFGDRGGQLVSEYEELNPRGYERSVSGAYWHIDKTSRKTRVPLINIFTGWVYGPGSWFEAMVRGLKNGSARQVGNGANYMSLIHIEDLARAYARIVEKVPIGERFCLVDGDPVTQRGLLEFLSGQLSCPMPKEMDAQSYSSIAGELAAETMECSVKVSAERTKKSLGIELKYPSYKEGMPQAIAGMEVPVQAEKAA